MILFFYGENDYLLRKKLEQLKSKYKTASKGSFDLINLDGDGLSFENFCAQTQTMALFTTTRLIIINQIFDAPKETLDKIKTQIAHIGPGSVVVFIHVGKFDKRLGLFKVLNQPKTSQYFEEVELSALPKFISREAIERGASFAPGADSYLIEIVGADLWQLSNEVEKLAIYKNGQKITKDDIDNLVVRNTSASTFALIDALIAGNQKNSLKELEGILAINEPPLKLLGAINFQARLIAQIKDELDRGTPREKLFSTLKVNPFPLKKALPYASKFSWQDLDKFYCQMSSLDENIKTGKISPEEALKELVLNL